MAHLEAPGPVVAPTLPESRVREVAAPQLTSTATFPATARQVTAAPTGGQLLLAASTAMAANLKRDQTFFDWLAVWKRSYIRNKSLEILGFTLSRAVRKCLSSTTAASTSSSSAARAASLQTAATSAPL